MLGKGFDILSSFCLIYLKTNFFRLFVREDGDHQVNIIGITEIDIKNLDDLHYTIDDGLEQRHHGKSAFNSNSSRSHAVFQIILKNNYNSSEVFR